MQSRSYIIMNFLFPSVFCLASGVKMSYERESFSGLHMAMPRASLKRTLEPGMVNYGCSRYNDVPLHGRTAGLTYEQPTQQGSTSASITSRTLFSVGASSKQSAAELLPSCSRPTPFISGPTRTAVITNEAAAMAGQPGYPSVEEMASKFVRSAAENARYPQWRLYPQRAGVPVTNTMTQNAPACGIPHHMERSRAIVRDAEIINSGQNSPCTESEETDEEALCQPMSSLRRVMPRFSVAADSSWN